MIKVGRAILTHREELVSEIKKYYLDSGRTEYLVVAYNQISVDPKKFVQTENFKLFPYLGKGPNGSIFGQMFLVWADVTKAFPEVETWVMHDYDVIVKPKDSVLAACVNSKEYGMVGKPFVYNSEAIESAKEEELYPFLKSGLSLSLNSEIYKYLETELLKNYALEKNGQKAILTGYGDLIVSSRENLMLLGVDNLRNLKNGGAEQVPHTVFPHFGIKPIDLKKSFSCFISLDNTVYANFKSKYDISHPVKFWPGISEPSLKLKIKRFLKILMK